MAAAAVNCTSSMAMNTRLHAWEPCDSSASTVAAGRLTPRFDPRKIAVNATIATGTRTIQKSISTGCPSRLYWMTPLFPA